MAKRKNVLPPNNVLTSFTVKHLLFQLTSTPLRLFYLGARSCWRVYAVLTKMYSSPTCCNHKHFFFSKLLTEIFFVTCYRLFYRMDLFGVTIPSSLQLLNVLHWTRPPATSSCGKCTGLKLVQYINKTSPLMTRVCYIWVKLFPLIRCQSLVGGLIQQSIEKNMICM